MSWMAWGLVAGASAAAWLPPGLRVACFAAAAAVPRRGAALALLLGLVAGEIHFQAGLAAYRALVARCAGEHAVAGRVLAFTQPAATGTRLTVAVDRGPLRGAHLRLFWPAPAPPVAPGDRVVLEVRLRPIRGLANPGGFDSEGWAFSAPVHAGGYVRAGEVTGPAGGIAAWLDRLRDRLARAIVEAAPAGAGERLLPALGVADRRGLTSADREVLQTTGTMHLLAISGLHIGLVATGAMAFGWLIWPLLRMPGSRRGWALALGLLAGVAYAALAGFALSTCRALLMLLGLAVAWWSRGRLGPARGLLAAAAVLILFRPAAVASAAFWLSFGAVACLAVAAAGWHGGAVGRRLVRAQAGIFLGLRPITTGFGLASGVVAPLCNLVAIPWVGWLVVPVLLAGVLALALGLPGGGALVAVAAAALEPLHAGLRETAERIVWRMPAAGAGWGGALPATGALLLLAPAGLALRAAGALLLAVSLVPTPAAPRAALDLHVLDVGQGLAVLVESDGRRMLYDAGPRTHSGWSAGEAVVVPFLRRSGPPRLDRVILSHGDLDHAGGWPAVRDAVALVEPPRAPEPAFGDPCRSGLAWRWGAARFRVIHPDPGLPDLGNDSSCVLLIEAFGERILLPGDVGAAVEERLARRTGPVSLLLAAHHGSAGSSSPRFVAATRPRVVVFSHGYGNRFGMPRPDVSARFGDAVRLSTAACGHLHFRLDAFGLRLLAAERHARRRPWHPHRRDDGVENEYDCAPRRITPSPRGKL